MNKVLLSPAAIKNKLQLHKDIEDTVGTTLDDLAKIDLAKVENYRENLQKPLKAFKGDKLRRARPRVPASEYRVIWQQGDSSEIRVIAIWRRDENTYTHSRVKNRLQSSLQRDDWMEWNPTNMLAEGSRSSTIVDTKTDAEQVKQEKAQLPKFNYAGILDYLIQLSPSQKSLMQTNAKGPILIRGVAGSGKTSLGLHRAQHISKLRTQSGKVTSILILTYSKALKTALYWSYAESFSELPPDLIIDSFGDWMLEILQESGLDFSVNQSPKESIRSVREEVASSHPQGEILSSLSSSFLLEEINEVIRGRDIGSLEDYIQVKRTGRRRGLNQSRRELMWLLYQKYQQELRNQNKFDWAELPQLVSRHCKPLPQFDVIIIDEAQDMLPNYLNLATKLIKDYSEHRSLTLLGDLAQSIHYSGTSWRDARLPLRGGRTRLLSQNHRNTRQIMNVALPILDKCHSLGSVRRYHSPERIDITGEKPVLVRYTTPDDAIDYIASEIKKLRQSLQLDYSNFVIISPNTLAKSAMFRALKKKLPGMGINCQHFRDEDFLFEDEVGLITMHSAKGLEFPVVFLIDFEEGKIPYVGRSSASPKAIEERARKLAYVSMTRATQRLYLVYPKSNPSRFVHDILDANEGAVEKVDLR